jgi:ferredoxin
LRKKEEIAFTYMDFISCDRRYARHFAQVPESKWDDSLLPVDESLTREKKGFPDKVPFIYMVDNDNLLQKVIVDERMLREARRCREMWRSLQELGGIHNSHAEILLAREKKAWEARMQVEADKQTETVATVTPSSVVVEAEPERSRDEAYIDSPRCSTCNECVTLNNKMFAYDNNRQAFIADVNAGTYAQLVEAAENCQVSVIHPGKPRNPKEPGIEDLLKRAEAFR